jgi:hypothetical protein
MGTTERVRAARRWGADSIDSSLPLWSTGNLVRFIAGFTTPCEDLFSGDEGLIGSRFLPVNHMRRNFVAPVVRPVPPPSLNSNLFEDS